MEGRKRTKQKNSVIRREVVLEDERVEQGFSPAIHAKQRAALAAEVHQLQSTIYRRG
jgi:hypothetical protein